VILASDPGCIDHVPQARKPTWFPCASFLPPETRTAAFRVAEPLPPPSRNLRQPERRRLNNQSGQWLDIESAFVIARMSEPVFGHGRATMPGGPDVVEWPAAGAFPYARRLSAAVTLLREYVPPDIRIRVVNVSTLNCFCSPQNGHPHGLWKVGISTRLFSTQRDQTSLIFAFHGYPRFEIPLA